MHKVHRPTFIDALRYCQRLWLLPNDAFSRLDAQVKLQFSVYPVNPFMVPAKASHIAQMQKTQPEAPVLLVVGQAHQPIGDLCVLIAQLGLVAIAGLADAE